MIEIPYAVGEDANEPTYYLFRNGEVDASEIIDLYGEDIASDYYRNRDGWEDSWPVLFKIFDADWKVIETFEVSKDLQPEFENPMRLVFKVSQ